MPEVRLAHWPAMSLVDRLMNAWARALHRQTLCQWCHREERDPGTFRGLYCSQGCQTADADEQAYGV